MIFLFPLTLFNTLVIVNSYVEIVESIDFCLYQNLMEFIIFDVLTFD